MSNANLSVGLPFQAGLKVHRGAFNLRAVINKDPKFIAHEIVKAIESSKFFYKPVIDRELVRVLAHRSLTSKDLSL